MHLLLLFAQAPADEGVRILGVRLVGVSIHSAVKVGLTLIFVLVVLFAVRLLQTLAAAILRGYRQGRVLFWTVQVLHLSASILLIVGVLSIWFDNPARLATALGLFSAGLAFALQKVVTSIAGYFVILRGRTFNVGDRIVMGGVRGDVIALGFMQTTIMEMGQPPSVQSDEPAMWVKSRQYTGRIVTVPNSKIFDEPVYNYSRDFAFIWEEMSLPVPFNADRRRAEEILLNAARRQQEPLKNLEEAELRQLQRRYFVTRLEEFDPRVYMRLTDNWVELSVRFITRSYGIREVKDTMSREIMSELEKAGIGIASSTFEIVGLPPLRIERAAPSAKGKPAAQPAGYDGHDGSAK